MGIELIWEEENGDELARLNDPQSFVEQFLPSDSDNEFVCLRFVDPYGDTIFNRLQLPVLLQELKRCAAKPHELPVAEHLSSAVALVEKAQDHVHTYVRFVGD
jgi:hypothetical protein